MTVNNFFTTINIYFFLAGGIVGVVLALITKFCNRLIDDYFKEKETKRKKKRKLASQVIEICTEGSSVAYNVMPGSQRHVQLVSAQIEGLDKSIADSLRAYLGLWVLCAMRQTPGPYENKNPTVEDIKFAGNLQREAKIIEDSILKYVRKWE
ncbi:MAG: hypothetical protein A2W22_00195 [Candidatus Levybacteria bacterium RBG_16_35_11]|nr:MAG: hypothetical protein A2W22_00195 [Candidatus Levybacteria bacterium RBG_16_35_11]